MWDVWRLRIGDHVYILEVEFEEKLWVAKKKMGVLAEQVVRTCEKAVEPTAMLSSLVEVKLDLSYFLAENSILGF